MYIGSLREVVVGVYVTWGYCNYIINFYETEMTTLRLKQLEIFAVIYTAV